MKKKNRILSMLLILAMILTIWPQTTLSAYARKAQKPKKKSAVTVLYPKETLQLSKKKTTRFSTNNKKIATVSGKGLVRAKKKGSVRITIKNGRKKTVRKITVKAAPAVTRASWIKSLVKASGTYLTTTKSGLGHYSDTRKKSFEKYVQTAYEKNAIPEKGRKFHPYRPATREFAAYSAVNILGYTTETSPVLNCSDSQSLRYKGEDQVALDLGIISLKKNKFCPSSALSKKDSSKAISAVKADVNGSSSENKNEITESSSVNKDLFMGDETYTVKEYGNTFSVDLPDNETTRKIKTGQILIVPVDGDSVKGIKVAQISTDYEGIIRVSGPAPSIDELYSSMEVSTSATATSAPTKINRNVVSSIKEVPGRSSSINKRYEVKLNESTDKYISLGDDKVWTTKIKCGKAGTLTPKITIDAPSVYAAIDIDGSLLDKDSYKEVTLKIKNGFQAKANFKLNEAFSKPDPKQIATWDIPIPETPFTVQVDMYLVFGVDGEATIQYTFSKVYGIQYRGGHLRFIDERPSHGFGGSELQVNAHLYIEPDANLIAFAGVSKVINGVKKWFHVDNAKDDNFKVIGIKADIGPNIKVHAKTYNDKPYVCASIDLYMYLNVGMVTDSGIGKLLKEHTTLKLDKTILDTNSSNPCSAHWHWEDGQQVSACTRDSDGKKTAGLIVTKGSGTINGVVKNADTKAAIADTVVGIYNRNKKTTSVKTDKDGKYSAKVRAGDYQIRISASGYKPFTYNVTVEENRDITIENFLLVDGDNLNGTATGVVRDSLTGNDLSNVKIRVRSGWNTEGGTVLFTTKTDYEGRYTLELTDGYYTLELTKSGYVKAFKNIYVSQASQEDQSTVLNPIGQENSYRIVLKWGDQPRDLDSHLTGFREDGSEFHVYYSSKTAYDDDVTIANLDVDDTNGEGPETLTVIPASEMPYTYYVYKYAGEGDLSSSNATVELYKGGTLLHTYAVPTTGTGRYWEVFTISGNDVIDSDIISDNAPGYEYETE